MSRIRNITAIIVTMLFSTGVVLGDGNDSKKEELIEKYQSRIDKAKEHDWQTYAECADELLSLRITCEEVCNWIDKSIKIKETVQNRTLKGDLLVLQQKFTEAKKEYIKAITLAQHSDEAHKIADIQWKILVASGIENYHNFHVNQE
jgi:hypothetical protein